MTASVVHWLLYAPVGLALLTLLAAVTVAFLAWAALWLVVQVVALAVLAVLAVLAGSKRGGAPPAGSSRGRPVQGTLVGRAAPVPQVVERKRS